MSTRARYSRLQAALVATVVVVVLLGGGNLLVRGTESVFKSTGANNAANAWTSGKVVLADNASGAALFTGMPLMRAGTAYTSCITVEYKGTVSAPVKVYATAPNLSTLGAYIDFTIEEANNNAVIAANCSSFPAATVIYSSTVPGASAGTLAHFATNKTNHGNGVGNWTPSSDPTFKAYRFTATLKSTTPVDQQGLETDVTFVWEAKAGV